MQNCKSYLFIFCTFFISSKLISQEESLFVNPPNEFKPKTWFHAMSGNMTKAGLTKDLESMAEVGIGGLLLFNVTQGIPNGPIIYNSKEHHELITHAAIEAERLKLSFGVHNCDGWSSSGGPWVRPEESMKMLVWSEQIVEGGDISLRLKRPSMRENYYEDLAVIAYPSLKSEIDDESNKPIITASDKLTDLRLIANGRIDSASLIRAENNQRPWIQYTYNSEKTIRSAMMVFHDRRGAATLQTSVDGIHWKDERILFKVRTGKGEWAINDHFQGITSKYFRLLLSEEMRIKEARLTSTYYLNNLLGRTAIARTENKDFDNIGFPERDMLIPQEQILDLSEHLRSNGELKASLKAGPWTILRFGVTSTGAFNNPASDEGRGLEVDKLSRPAFKKHYDAFVKTVIDNTKLRAPNAVQYVEIDSYEMGGQNWTDNLDKLFLERFDYDFLDFLPLVAGRFVESREISDAVLYDFRKIISDLMTKNYFHYFTELLHKDSLKSYIEPYGFGPLNDLDIVANTDLPMGEFWMNRPITQVKSAVSGAHIYGRDLVSAESFTSIPTINWKGNPAMAKNSGDLAWTQGINEFMFHRFAHQANTFVEPGMTMNRWGFHFDRTQTWWYNAGADWFKYIARGSYLLRSGIPVSDFAVFVGDGSPNSAFRRDQIYPSVPKSINFDCINSDVLINRSKILQRLLTLPEGTNYKALYLMNSKSLELETILRLVELVKLGFPIYGEKPETLAGYGHSESEQKEFNEAARFLNNHIKSINSWKEFIKELNIVEDLKVNNGDPIDFIHRKIDENEVYFFYNSDSLERHFELSFRVQNKIPEIWNPMTGTVEKVATFKLKNKTTSVEINLDPYESAFIVFREKVNSIISIKEASKLHTLMDSSNNLMIEVLKNGNQDILFSNNQKTRIRANYINKDIPIKGNWNVTFEDQTYTFDSLFDWSRSLQDEIKYFSGTATYKKSFDIPKGSLNDNTIVKLDLGNVSIVAEVIINGVNVGVDWISPFQLDIGHVLKEGENSLEILITNQWSNKLIGDERFPANDGNYKLGPHRATDLEMPEWYVNNEDLPPGNRTTFTTAPFYSKDDPLMSSGLLGPVTISFSEIVDLKNEYLPQINMPNGRIAFTSDGNLHDSDDWGATAFSLAILKAAKLDHKLVHYDYNNHLGNSRESWEAKMDTIVNSAIKRFGLNRDKFFNNQSEKENAIANFVFEASKSNKQDPLWLICAGPMQTAYDLLAACDPKFHPYIHLISHSTWNENHSHGETSQTWKDIQADFPKLIFHEILDQNTSNGEYDFNSQISNWEWIKEETYSEYSWLYETDDTWQVDSLENWESNTKEVFDVSDAGMTYWLITGGPQGGHARAGWREVRELFGGIKSAKRNEVNLNINGDDYIMLEAESTKSMLRNWHLISKEDKYFVDSASGGKYLEFTGNSPSHGPPNSPLTYTFTAPKTGKFRLIMMASKRLEGERGDWCNDAYVKMEGEFTSASTLKEEDLRSYLKFFQEGSVNTPELSWNWAARAEKGRHEFHHLEYHLKKGETYTLSVAGRSQRFSMDYIILYDSEKIQLSEAQLEFGSTLLH